MVNFNFNLILIFRLARDAFREPRLKYLEAIKQNPAKLRNEGATIQFNNFKERFPEKYWCSKCVFLRWFLKNPFEVTDVKKRQV